MKSPHTARVIDRRSFYAYLFLMFFFIGCESQSTHQYIELPLKGQVTDRNEEISSMTIYNDKLVLLPENLNGYIFWLPLHEIEESITRYQYSKIDSLRPRISFFRTENYNKTIYGFDGFEALVIHDDSVYIMIEVKDVRGEAFHMSSFLIWGSINSESMEVIIPNSNIIRIPTPTQVYNQTFEGMSYHNGKLIIMYEVNGVNMRIDVWQYMVDINTLHDDELVIEFDKLMFPNIEYRVTDMTSVIDNKFWVTNYFWPGDKEMLQIEDSIGVERLVEFEIIGDVVVRSNYKPINIPLGEKSRNWEGVVRYKDGFLISTDKFPKMILGYIR
jgi:hypothetical protein|tara:strand:- start:1324 stop:2310 length:987 start_codon:yes stop_codon:yes gene_type:complete